MNEETIGQRLRRLRLAAGRSQRELSGPGVSYAYISRIEAGTRHPSVRALRTLAARLDVSAEYLETGYEKTITDERLETLADVSPVWAISRNGDDTVAVYWSDELGPHHVERPSLTDALAGALAAVTANQALLVERERLRAELDLVEAQIGGEE